MTRIVELCSTANEVEAHLICAALDDAGISARVVGGNLANTAGLGLAGEIATPRIWVFETELARARQILEDLRSQIGESAGDDFPDDLDEEESEGDDDDEALQRESLAPTRAVTQFGLRLLVGFACVLLGSLFCLTARAVLLGVRDGAPIGAVIEPFVVAVCCAGLTLFLVRVMRTRLRSGGAPDPRQ